MISSSCTTSKFVSSLGRNYFRSHFNNLNKSNRRYVCNDVTKATSEGQSSSKARILGNTPLSSSAGKTQTKKNYAEDFRFVRDVMLQITSGMGLAYCVSEYGFNTTACEGPSMIPTLHDEGDVILVEKVSHRLFGIEGGENGFDRAQKRMKREDKLRKKSRQNGLKGEYNFDSGSDSSNVVSSMKSIWTKITSGVVVGDVIVCQHPKNDGTICKRVIALPGDVVELHRSLRYTSQPDLSVVPDGHIWVEGDNTINSNDSRHYGAIPASLIVGKVLFRLWPITREAMVIDRMLPGAILRDKSKAFTGSSVTPAGIPLTKSRRIR